MVDETSVWTVASAVGALGVGGFVASWWAHWLRERAAKKREERERCALLRLLLGEIDHNREVVRGAREEQTRLEQIGSTKLSLMKTETWRATRTRAAQLVPDNLLRSLEDYYIPLETLLTLLKSEEGKTGAAESAGGKTRAGGNEERKRKAAAAGERWFRALLRQEFGDEWKLNRAGEYAVKTFDAQDPARKQLCEYLGLNCGTDHES